MKKKMFKNIGIRREILYYILKNMFEILKIIASLGLSIVNLIVLNDEGAYQFLYIFLLLIFGIYYERFYKIKNKATVLNLIYLIINVIFSIICILKIIFDYKIIEFNILYTFETLTAMTILLFTFIEANEAVFPSFSQKKSLPLTISKNYDEGTVNAIETAVKNENVFNVGIVGPYASGKSTNLNSFEKKNEKRYDMLQVSLATFDGVKNSSKSDNDDVLILKKIYQEIINMNSFRVYYVLSLAISLFLFLIVYIINSHYRFIETIDYGYMIFCFLYVILYIILSLSLPKVSKGEVKLGDVAVNLEKIDSKQEITIYENGIVSKLKKFNKNVIIIFEDLDRFENLHLFYELRALNKRFNNQLAKKVIFIYAVKPEIFNSPQDMCKFFDDYIVMQPILTNKNKYSKLLSAFQIDMEKGTNEYDIKNEMLQIISSNVSDMRILQKYALEAINDIKRFKKINQEYYRDSNKIICMTTIKMIYPFEYRLLETDNYLERIFERSNNFGESISQYQKDPFDVLMLDLIYKHNKLTDTLSKKEINKYQLKKIICEELGKNSKIISKINDKFSTFLMDVIAEGFLEEDYIDYYSPIKFDENMSSDDIKIRRKIIFNEKLESDDVIKDPALIISSLELSNYVKISILNYQIISTLYKNHYFYDNEIAKFKQTFYIDKKEFIPEFISLVKCFIDKNIDDKKETDIYFLEELSQNSSLYNQFGSKDCKYVSFLLSLVLTKNNIFKLSGKYINVISSDDINYHELVRFLSNDQIDMILDYLSDEINLSGDKNTDIDCKLINNFKFKASLDNLKIICKKNKIDSKNITTIYNLLDGDEVISNRYPYNQKYNKLKSLILNLKTFDPFYDTIDAYHIIYKLGYYDSDSKELISKINCEIESLDDECMKSLLKNKRLDMKKIKLSLENFEIIVDITGTEVRSEFIKNHPEVFIKEEYLDLLKQRGVIDKVLETYMDKYEIDIETLNHISEKYSLNLNSYYQNNIPSMRYKNLLKYALKYDPDFKKINPNVLYEYSQYDDSYKQIKDYKKYKEMFDNTINDINLKKYEVFKENIYDK